MFWYFLITWIILLILYFGVDRDIRAGKNADGPFTPKEAIRYLSLLRMTEQSFVFWHNTDDAIYDSY